MPLMSQVSRRDSKERQFLRQIAGNIRKAREKKGYSQEELAEVAGFSRSYYNEIETGKRNISLINLKKIMDALELSADQLFEF